jgi:hypothetical protein
MLDRAFGNMLLHLLHGEFAIDRAAIDFEAFTRDGKTYAYFGVFPAPLRLVAMPFTDIAQAELARSRARRWRFYEVGISYYGRTYDEGKKINWLDGLRALVYLFKFRICGR